MMNFEELPEFRKDIKSLSKKYKSIPDDLLVVKQVLEVYPDERPPFSFRISHLGLDNCIIKIKKIACRSLKGRGRNSGLRIVYAYFETEKRIVFIELYHKNQKASEDRERIMKYF